MNNQARIILEENTYVTLATAIENVPWASPVFYGTDKELSFYFISLPSSRHIKNIEKNNHVSFAIFDSTQPADSGTGIQGDGTIVMIEQDNLGDALQHYHTTFVNIRKEYVKKDGYRLYKLIPDHFYMLDPEAAVDLRVEVFPKSAIMES